MELIRQQSNANGSPDAQEPSGDALESFRARTGEFRRQLNTAIQHVQHTNSTTFHESVRQTTAQ